MSEDIELTEDERERLVVDPVELDFACMTPTERKRYKARLRKPRQREHEKAVIPSDPEQKMNASWSVNRAAIMSDPEKLPALEERWSDFRFVRKQMSAVIDRIRHGVHPDVEAAGRFYDCVAEDVLEHEQKYGLVGFHPVEILHLVRPSVIEEMKADPKFYHRIHLGLTSLACRISSIRTFLSITYRGICPIATISRTTMTGRSRTGFIVSSKSPRSS